MARIVSIYGAQNQNSVNQESGMMLNATFASTIALMRKIPRSFFARGACRATNS